MEAWIINFSYLKNVKTYHKITFYHLQTEIAAPTMVDKSYAATAVVPKLYPKSVVINTKLTWHVDEAKYNKLSNIEKTEK